MHFTKERTQKLGHVLVDFKRFQIVGYKELFLFMLSKIDATPGVPKKYFYDDDYFFARNWEYDELCFTRELVYEAETPVQARILSKICSNIIEGTFDILCCFIRDIVDDEMIGEAGDYLEISFEEVLNYVINSKSFNKQEGEDEPYEFFYKINKKVLTKAVEADVIEIENIEDRLQKLRDS